MNHHLYFFGTPGRIRTCDLQLRRLTPYPLGYGRLQNTLLINSQIEVNRYSNLPLGLPRSRWRNKNRAGRQGAAAFEKRSHAVA